MKVLRFVCDKGQWCTMGYGFRYAGLQFAGIMGDYNFVIQL